MRPSLFLPPRLVQSRATNRSSLADGYGFLVAGEQRFRQENERRFFRNARFLKIPQSDRYVSNVFYLKFVIIIITRNFMSQNVSDIERCQHIF